MHAAGNVHEREDKHKSEWHDRTTQHLNGP